jgi:protein O-GlcNAc transferase
MKKKGRRQKAPSGRERLNTGTELQKAIQYHESGQLQQAESRYKKILRTDPNQPDALHLLGVMAYQNGNHGEAVRLIKKAIGNNPKNPFYYNNLGAVFNAQDRHAEALWSYHSALKLDPDYADAHYNIGNIHQKQDMLGKAISSYQRALETDSNHVNARYNMGNALKSHGRPAQAIECYQQVIERNPGHSTAHNNMGHAFKILGELDRAMVCYKKALESNPHNAEAVINTGSAFQDLGQFEAALECYNRALALDSHYAAPYAGLAFIMLSLGEITAIGKLKETILTKLDMFLDHDPSRWLDELIYLSPLLSLDKRIRGRLTDRMDRILSDLRTKPRLSIPDSHNKLKIGYVSPDFGDHPISHVLRGVFSNHDHSAFEIFAYSLKDRSHETSDYYQQISSNCDHFIDLSRLSDDDAAKRIAADGIAVLIDLTGYMKDARLEIFARRPAPVQIYWLGHGGGLGLSFIDYVIADYRVIPPGEEILYKEKIIRMPEVYHPADTPPISDAPVCRSDFGLDENATVFCVFNNPQKINAEVFDAWMRILHRVPDSLLWLSNPKQSIRLVQNLKNEAQHRKVDPKRLIFAARLPDKSQHFSRHRLADLFLDTFSYNASTTAIDALWAGLPILTRAGKTFYSRICADFLTHVGLGDMVCETTKEYEERAIALAKDKAALAKLKERLLRNRKTEPLFNTPRFVGHLEKAYKIAWDCFKSGSPPDSFDVPAVP